MVNVATTITEHIQYKSEAKGEIKGEIKGQIKLLEGLHAEGLLSKEQFEKKVAPLRQELADLLDGKDGRDPKKTDHLTVIH